MELLLLLLLCLLLSSVDQGSFQRSLSFFLSFFLSSYLRTKIPTNQLAIATACISLAGADVLKLYVRENQSLHMHRI